MRHKCNEGDCLGEPAWASWHEGKDDPWWFLCDEHAPCEAGRAGPVPAGEPLARGWYQMTTRAEV